jgi:peptidase S41-like protein
MNAGRFLIATLLAVPFSILPAAPGKPPVHPWGEMARRDLQAIHDTVRDNHPGPVDPENPNYRDWLEKGLRVASREARRAQTYSDYVAALRRYTNGFQDGHLTVSFDVAPTKTDWTGFVIGPGADGQPQVVYADGDSGARVGDRLDSCDGHPFDALMKERVDPYFWNRAIPHARLNFATTLFLANPDQRGTSLNDCRFSSGDVHLHWRTADTADVNKTLVRALSGDDAFAIKSVHAVWFVRLPRFWITSDSDAQKLQGIVSELAAKARELRQATVVFDVRGNGGGDSLWGRRLAVALWGEPWVERVEQSFDSTHDVRVSAANIKKVSDIIEFDRKNGQQEALPYWTSVLHAMESARAAGRPLARIGEPPSKPAGPPPPNPISGRVFLLTDGGCGSACLDFADLLVALPGVTVVGLPTSADAVYIDVNDARLPSGLGTLFYGMKVFRHRVRANNQWYEPKYRWPGGPMTDDALAAWIRSLPQ